MKKTLLLFYLCSYTFSLFSQMSEDKYQAFNKHTVPGLSNNINTNIHFDTSGTFWVGSNDGLIKYNGTQWQVFNNQNSSLNYNSIGSLALDSKNNLWMTNGYNEGLIQFDGVNTWTFYNNQNSSMPSVKLNDIVVDQNDNIWIASADAGLIKYDGTSFSSYNKDNGALPTSNIYRVYIDSNNEKWLICGDGLGIVKLNASGSSYKMYNETKEKVFTNIYKDSGGRLWAGTYFKGAMYFDGVAWQNAATIQNSDLGTALVWTFGKDKEGSLLLGTTGYGLWKYKSDGLTQIGGQVNLVKYARINSIAIDRQNNTWIGTADTGLVKIQSSEVTALKKINPDLSKNVVYFPNPNTDRTLQGNYTSDVVQTIHVTLYDISGLIINQYSHSLSKGNNLYLYDISQLNSGIYFIKVDYKEASVTKKVSILN